MNFQETEIAGVLIVTAQPNNDPRGTFVRVHSCQEFADHKLKWIPEQTSLSHNVKSGTVRGLHFQAPPYTEAKLVCCVAGAAFDAVVDLRRQSPTFGRALWFDLVADRSVMIHVPEGCAHGFQTLEDDTTLLYMISAPYRADAARGIRWDDPALRIPWPKPKAAFLSERDRSLPMLSQIASPF
jgi:dTDP-4-dehydrorhamnose 3,5-epimerase